jgi:hypothetical protein
VLAHDLRLVADYNQFYVWDAGVGPRAPEDYRDDDVIRMVKVAPNVVVVQPASDVFVSVRLEVHDGDPGCDIAGWDHVVECSLELPTGHLQVHECTGGAALDLHLAPGTYRVRALFEGLDSLSATGAAGDDRYVVVLWPGEAQPLRVLKQFPISRLGRVDAAGRLPS